MDATRRFGPHLLAAALVTACLAAPVADASPTPARADAAKRCLWPKRDCYPPAHLWYRVSLRFKGETSYESPPGAIYSGPDGYSKVVDGVQTHAVVWEVKSQKAVRLTLRCVDRAVPEQPFLVERRAGGRRRPVGGCGRKASKRLAPSVSFAAIVEGETTRSVKALTVEPFTIANGHRCAGHTGRYDLTSPEGLGGVVRTESSASEGLLVWLFNVAPEGALHYEHGERTCTDSSGREYIWFAQQSYDRAHGARVLLGNEYVLPQGATRWEAASKLVRFSLRPGNFGRDYIIQGRVEQPQRVEGTYPAPPIPPLFEQHRKDYVYTLRLAPCPNGGLDVERC